MMRRVFASLLVVMAACSKRDAGSSDKPPPSLTSKAPNEAPGEASVRALGDEESGRKVDVGALVDGTRDKDSGSTTLPVNLDGIKNDAPVIVIKPPSDAAQIIWIDAGSDSIPSFGFTKQSAQDLVFLEAPDKSGGIVFTTFRDQSEGGKKIATLVARLKLKDTRWKKPKAILLPADKIPALIGGGHGTDPDGKGVKVVYAFIKGDPNILAIAGVNDSASQTIQDEVFATIGGIKRKPR